MNYLKIHRKNQAGFTLIELLLALSISGIIMIGITSLLLTLFSTNKHITDLDQIEQVKNDLTMEFTNNVRWADDVVVHSTGPEGSFSIIIDGVSHDYALNHGLLFKDGHSLQSELVTITSFYIVDKSVTGNYKSLEITVEMQHAQYPTVKDLFTIVVSQRMTEISV